MPPPPRPTVTQLQTARTKLLPDVIKSNLHVLFCGINPSLYSAAVSHHFARPGNRFWPALFRSGFTNRLLNPAEDRQLLDIGCGVTNLVPRPTVSADELSKAELLAGAIALKRKINRYKPSWIAFVGIGAFRIAFNEKKAKAGRQKQTIGETGIWVLPNTSGLNANHQIADLARLFGELREAIRQQTVE
jgi:TDG/mug DNA glycosylase family protein